LILTSGQKSERRGGVRRVTNSFSFVKKGGEEERPSHLACDVRRKKKEPFLSGEGGGREGMRIFFIPKRGLGGLPKTNNPVLLVLGERGVQREERIR